MPNTGQELQFAAIESNMLSARRAFRYRAAVLGDDLREQVESLHCTANDILNLDDEVTVLRLLTSDAIGFYESARNLPVDNPKRMEAMGRAAGYLRETVNGVAEIANKSADIQVKLSGVRAAVLDSHFVQGVVDALSQTMAANLTRCAPQLVEAGVDIDALGEALIENLDIASHGIGSANDSQVGSVLGRQGTKITPDSIVLEMDATVCKARAM